MTPTLSFSHTTLQCSSCRQADPRDKPRGALTLSQCCAENGVDLPSFCDVVVQTSPSALFGCGDVMMDRRRDQAGRRERGSLGDFPQKRDGRRNRTEDRGGVLAREARQRAGQGDAAKRLKLRSHTRRSSARRVVGLDSTRTGPALARTRARTRP
jgi:hypothetical protein